LGANAGLEGSICASPARSGRAASESGDRIAPSPTVDIRPIALDLGVRPEREKLIADCTDIDILVNNAGNIPSGTIDEMTTSLRTPGAEAFRLHRPDARLFHAHEGKAATASSSTSSAPRRAGRNYNYARRLDWPMRR